MRLFIALDLPVDARDALVALQARLPAGVRPVSEENLHLTLAFLDEVSEEDAEAIHDGLDSFRAPAFPVSLSGVSLFGGRNGQALGLEAEGGAALRALHDRIRARLRGAGIEAERRRFRPHVTLARMSGKTDASKAVAALAGAAVAPFRVQSFGLYQSLLHRDGPVYEALATYPLLQDKSL